MAAMMVVDDGMDNNNDDGMDMQTDEVTLSAQQLEQENVLIC